MGRILVIIGGISGGLVFVSGVLLLIGNATEPGPDQEFGYVLFGAVTFVGLAIAVPCVFFAYRMTPPVALGMQYGSAGAPVGGTYAEPPYPPWVTSLQHAI